MPFNALLAAMPPAPTTPDPAADAGFEQLWQAQLAPAVQGNILLRRHATQVKASLKRVWDARGVWEAQHVKAPVPPVLPPPIAPPPVQPG
jgi:hypothetical protein